MKILVADDNRVNQRVAIHFLGHLGHECDVVASGTEVLRALALGPYDLILMDVLMPGMDGIETTKRIRAGGYGSPRIVAVSASDAAEDRAACAAAGMDGFLSKPVSLDSLRAVIER